jgi:hypothetical protein
MRHEIPEEPARRGSHTLVSPSASTGPLKNMDAPSPARKAHAHEMQKKTAGSIFEHLRTAMARTGRYEEGALHKAGVGANPRGVSGGVLAVNTYAGPQRGLQKRLSFGRP